MRRMSLAAVFAVLLAAPALALTPRQLTPREQQVYQTVKNDPNEAAAFLATREYVRKAQAVINGSLPAIKMPDKPANFEDQYLFPGEVDLVNRAVSLALFALMDSGMA